MHPKMRLEWKTVYRKFPKYSDTPKNCCNHPKSWTRWRFLRVMHPKDAEGIANSVDPDQTAPLGAVWSGSGSDCSSRSSLIWVCTVCRDLSVRKLRKITVDPDTLPEYLGSIFYKSQARTQTFEKRGCKFKGFFFTKGVQILWKYWFWGQN